MTQIQHQQVFNNKTNTADTVDFADFYSSPDIPEWVRRPDTVHMCKTEGVRTLMFQIFTSSTVYLAIIGTTGVSLNLSVIFLFIRHKKVLTVITEGQRSHQIIPATDRFQLFTAQPHRHRAGRVLHRNPGGRRGLLPTRLEDGSRPLSDSRLLSHPPGWVTRAPWLKLIF